MEKLLSDGISYEKKKSFQDANVMFIFDRENPYFYFYENVFVTKKTFSMSFMKISPI